MEQKNETNPFGIQSESQASSEEKASENKSEQTEKIKSVEVTQQNEEPVLNESKREVDVFEILSISWNKFKQNWKFLVILSLIYFVIRVVEGVIQKAVDKNSAGIFFASILLVVLNIFIAIGVVQIFLKISRGAKAEYGEILGGGKYFWKLIGGSILYGLIVLSGFILLIIPGIIWQYKYGMFSYLIIDKDMGPLEAIKESGKLMYGNKWKLFFLQLLMIPVVFAGILFFGVGILAAIPVVTLMSVTFYRIISGENVSA